ncbi:Uncharacterised protein [uncultured archaeon]|nr:Uncharacterised protein [uncultured archaeon]
MKVMTEEQADLDALRGRLRLLSLLGTVFSDLVFVVVWWVFVPNLPIWVPVLFVALSLVVWRALVQPQIEDFARSKKK